MTAQPTAGPLTTHATSEDSARLAPSGSYVAFSVRFAFPASEFNPLPCEWVDLCSERRFFFSDPALRWSNDDVGAVRRNALAEMDPLEIVRQSTVYGLRYDPHGGPARHRALTRPELAVLETA